MIKKVKGYQVGDETYATLAEAQRAALVAWFDGNGIEFAHHIANTILDDIEGFRAVVKPLFPRRKRAKKGEAEAGEALQDEWLDEVGDEAEAA